MVSFTADEMCSDATSLRDSKWTTRGLVIGLAFLLLLRCIGPLVPDWIPPTPWWLLIVLTVVVPELFFVAFPFLTRRPRSPIRIPKLTRCLAEFGIAVPVVIVIIAALSAAEYLVRRLLPGTSLEPEAIKRMSETTQLIYLYPLLLLSFALAPIAEEVFFRGFLQNALRQRMPMVLATLVQSAIFGFGHTFGALHATFAFLMGILLTVLYTWRKTLITPIFVHSGVNLIAAIGVVFMAIGYANSAVLGVAGDPVDSKCVVRQVMPQSAAENAGLRVGDVVISFDGEPIRDFQHLRETVRLYQPGDNIPVVITRDGARIEVNVVLQRRGKE